MGDTIQLHFPTLHQPPTRRGKGLLTDSIATLQHSRYGGANFKENSQGRRQVATLIPLIDIPLARI